MDIENPRLKVKIASENATLAAPNQMDKAILC